MLGAKPVGGHQLSVLFS